MVQLPVALGVRVVPETVQFPETLVREMEPLPDPPLVATESVSPKATVVEVMERLDWEASEKVKVDAILVALS